MNTKITRQRLHEIIKEEINLILENPVTGDVSHDLMKSSTQIFGVPVKVTSKGVNVDGNRYKIEASVKYLPDVFLAPKKADLVTTADGKHSLNIELEVPGLGVKPGIINHATLEALVDSLKGETANTWRTRIDGNKIVISEA